MKIDNEPLYLYKILSMSNWEASQHQKALVLPKEDELFIHFSTEEQLDRILTKYWSKAEEAVILKIDRNRLKGKLVFEANPGGIAKYYHLYDGLIPLTAILEVRNHNQQAGNISS